MPHASALKFQEEPLTGSKNPIVAILQDTYQEDGSTRLSERWVIALQSFGLNVVGIDPKSRNDEVLTILRAVHGVFLPGGDTNVHPMRYGADEVSETEIFKGSKTPKHPFSLGRDRVSSIMVRYAYDYKMPCFAVCRGMQEMNVAFRGQLQ